MKVYLDCGAFRGRTIARFISGRPGYKVYAFECNPTLRDFNYGPGVVKINTALWTEPGEIDFYLSKVLQDKVEGSTMYRDKCTGNIDREHPVKTRTMDFGGWLKSMFRPDDYIVVKMNLEGAEYDIIPAMIKDGSIKLIDEIHIQWHYQKIFFPIESHREIVASLKATGIGYFHGYKHLYTGMPA